MHELVLLCVNQQTTFEMPSYTKNVAVGESAPQADTLSVCVIRTTAG